MNGLLTKAFRRLLRWPADRRGAMSPLFALMIVPIVGMLGLAAESSSWLYTQRSLQNAADSSARAAATAAGGGGSFTAAGAATAAKYGFTHGTGNVTVAISNVACPGGAPAGANTCYQADLAKTVPIYLTRVVGFNGSGPLGTGRGQIVTATAIASQQVNYAYCNIALNRANSNQGFQINGGSKVDLAGCDVFSNAKAECNGGGTGTPPWGINSAVEVGSHNNKLCGGSQTFGAAAITTTPWDNLWSSIPAATGCSGATTVNGGTLDLTSGSKCYTGNLTINGTVTVTGATPGSVLYMYNNSNIILGSGAKLVGPTTSGLTIAFTGNTNSYPGFVSGAGTLDFGAPTSGTWSGVALYQDSRLNKTSPLNNLTYSGSPNSDTTFNVTGLLYAPYAKVTISGAINKQSAGLNCFAIVSDSTLINGNGSIFAYSTSQCIQAGLILPTGPTPQFRVALVQ